MNAFERLKVQTDYGITFEATGLLQANRMPFVGREYYYPGEVPEDIVQAFGKYGPELVGFGVKEILFRFEAVEAGPTNAGGTKLVYEIELGPEWEQALPSPPEAGRNRAHIERLFVKIKDDLRGLGHPTFESILEPPSKKHMHGGKTPQEMWRARLWCKSEEFTTI